jgi:DNA-binding IscR family transcriptional regulator
MPDCSIRSVWRMVQGAVDDVLQRITVKDLLVPEREMKAFPAPGSALLPTVSSSSSL